MSNFEWPIECSPLVLRDAMIDAAAQIAVAWALWSVMCDLVSGGLDL
jgi:hypothetical protein